MDRKTFPARMKAQEGSEGTGTFEALVSVFGNVDSMGDVVMPGAFERTLEERGLPPVFYSHQWGVGPIGHTTAAKETDDGLVVTAELYVEDPSVSRIYRNMKAGALKEFSFAYEVVDSTVEERDGDEVRLLTDVELYEVGPTLVGANDQTELLQVRAKGVIGYREGSKAPEDTAWDGASEIARADTDDLRAMCAWYDANEPDLKSSYKLPHHRSDGGHPVVWRGVSAAMGSLLRGGVTIPAGDREGVYNHLASHYRQFDKEPPEFRSADLDSIEHREPDPGLLERRSRLLLARPRLVFRREGGGNEALRQSA